MPCNQLQRKGDLPPLKIFVDSPAVNVTAIFANHPEAYDEETRASSGGDKAHLIHSVSKG